MPDAYVLLVARGIRVAVRRDLAPALAPWLMAPALRLPSDATPVASGRGAAFRVTLPGGRRAVVRLYRRGGAVARVVRESYVGLFPRPLRELVATDEARRRGVAAAEVLAARVDGRLVHRGALVTAEVPGATTLLDALRAAPDAAARLAVARAAGRAVGGLHAAGVFHADLNLTNILVRGVSGAPEATLVDFDRACLRPPPLGRRACRRNLRRLARSAAKLDPGRAVAGADEVRAFIAAYAAGEEDPCAC
jgi:3-deoxy-D-manno-octulosonic acid kinase